MVITRPGTPLWNSTDGTAAMTRPKSTTTAPVESCVAGVDTGAIDPQLVLVVGGHVRHRPRDRRRRQCRLLAGVRVVVRHVDGVGRRPADPLGAPVAVAQPGVEALRLGERPGVAIRRP